MIKSKVLVAIGFGVVLVSVARADMLPPDSHRIERCVIVDKSNLAADYTIVLKSTVTVMPEPTITNTVTEVNAETCLSGGSRGGTVSSKANLYAVAKSTIQNKGGVSNLTLGGEGLSLPADEFILNSDTRTKEVVYFSVFKTDADFVYLYQTKVVTTHDDGHTATTTYPAPK